MNETKNTTPDQEIIFPEGLDQNTLTRQLENILKAIDRQKLAQDPRLASYVHNEMLVKRLGPGVTLNTQIYNLVMDYLSNANEPDLQGDPYMQEISRNSEELTETILAEASNLPQATIAANFQELVSTIAKISQQNESTPSADLQKKLMKIIELHFRKLLDLPNEAQHTVLNLALQNRNKPTAQILTIMNAAQKAALKAIEDLRTQTTHQAIIIDEAQFVKDYLGANV